MVQRVSKKVSELPLVTALASTDYLPVVAGGVTSRILRDGLGTAVLPYSYLASSLVPNSVASAIANMAVINASVVAASAASVALSGPIEVLLPAGFFYIAGTAALLSNVTLRGAGMGKTILRMPASAYTNTTWNSRNSTSMAFDASGLLTAPYTQARNIKLCDFTISSDDNDGRVLYGIRASNVVSLEISNVEIFGIPVGNAIEVNSIAGGSSVHHCLIRDCGTAVTTYAVQPQMTGIEIDNNKVNGEPSRGLDIHDNTVTEISFSGAALAGYGDQSDAINAADGLDLRIHDNYMRHVGEGIDVFAQGCDIHGNVLVDCYHAGIKLIHGATRNHVHGNTILRPGRAGVVLEGRSAETKDNYIHGNSIHDVNISGVWNSLSNAAFLVVSGGGIEANNNTIRDNKVTGGANMDYVVRNEAGTGNRFYDNEAESWLVLYSSVSGGSATITNAKKSFVRVYVGTNQSFASGVNERIDYDTETFDTQSEWDASAKLYTATSHRRLRVGARIQVTPVGSGELYILRVIKDGGAVAFKQFTTASASTFVLEIEDVLEVVPGSTIEVTLEESAGARTVTAGTSVSYLTIEEVAG